MKTPKSDLVHCIHSLTNLALMSSQFFFSPQDDLSTKINFHSSFNAYTFFYVIKYNFVNFCSAKLDSRIVGGDGMEIGGNFW